jgi:hypothetical protein
MSDPVGQFGRQQPVVGGLDCQLPHRRDSYVYGNGAQPASFQCHAPGLPFIDIKQAASR